MHTAILFDQFSQQWVQYQKPVELLVAHENHEVLPLLDQVEQLTEKGLHGVGFLSYEAAQACNPHLRAKKTSGFPLCSFAMFDRRKNIDIDPTPRRSPYCHWKANVSFDHYEKCIHQIKRYITLGESYQVNYTYRLMSQFTHDPLPYFFSLLHHQQTPFATYLELDDFIICSVSPELFFKLDGQHIQSKPMKGTTNRGVNLAEDQKNSLWLKASEKNRAENTMILDMIRNDIGRISTIGSVKVLDMHHVEKYKTALQMTSTVVGETSEKLSEIFAALFPSSSITGAPKVRTMEIVDELETTERKIYTGSIGYVLPNRRACFNVAIRTLLIDKKNRSAEYGVGGGIIWDSNAISEYHESSVKAKVLENYHPPISLLESLLWQPDSGYFLLDLHIARMLDSAAYLMIKLSEKTIREALTQHQNSLKKLTACPYKVRLICRESSGAVTVEHQALTVDQINPTQPVLLAFSRRCIHSQNWRLYHKLTDRDLYDQAMAESNQPSADDVILVNEKGELTETTRFNLILKIKGIYHTPALNSGLLPGVYRAYLLAQKKIQETPLFPQDFKQAECIYVINSVRQWNKATLLDA